jgi:uncharacterized RDD family membrane protein YckC
MITYATFGRRLAAFTIDVCIMLFAVGILAAFVQGAWLALLSVMLWLMYHVGLVMEGGTFGHRLLGLRVVHLDGTSVSFGSSLARALTLYFASLPPLGLGALWMLDQDERRGWHDLAASTIVVREIQQAAFAAPTWAAAPPWRATGDVATPYVAPPATPAVTDAFDTDPISPNEQLPPPGASSSEDIPPPSRDL